MAMGCSFLQLSKCYRDLENLGQYINECIPYSSVAIRLEPIWLHDNAEALI